ncbi:hypothetical protein SAMN06893096_108220 [Geodermatophilus pulveris]|uniref:Uncharacterized protein n=1 Tax=Geodermatophilus pulveris TaxID=1564159 RepID=A0A239HPW0_9ACTN|nr:hypothetical protein [Geodermatophilus pulveris]SNS83251.1 hypothetical protein SAMN06893096_108220 [Geodermatophilus pulveris]
MRVPILLYGVLYVVVEIVGVQLATIGWPQLTALDVATALANACLTVAVGIVVLAGMDVAGRRWRRSVEAWCEERALAAGTAWDEPRTITVPSWRTEPLALPAGPSSGGATSHGATSHGATSHGATSHGATSHGASSHHASSDGQSSPGARGGRRRGPTPGGDYAVPPRGRPFPEQPGHLL